MNKIYLKSQEEIKIMREGGKILANILELISERIAPGASGDEIEEFAEKEIKKYNAIPSFKNYKIHNDGAPFPSAICFSVNDEIVHGFPYGKILKEGDIVGIDLGIKYNGFHTDSAITVGAGKLSSNAASIIRVARESLYKGIAEVKIGNRIGDIGSAIQAYVEMNGFSAVRDLVGHGVGKTIHEPPEVPNFGEKGRGLKLCQGMTFAIEPMINEGKYDIKCGNDGWTIRTLDGLLSAHFEHTVAVTSRGCIILTQDNL